MNAHPVYVPGAIKRAPLQERIRKAILSVIAILFTIAPLFSISLWVTNVYFSDPRSTQALTVMPRQQTSPAPFQEPLVTITFDDGWESVYSKAAPILEKNHIRTTQYILSGQFEQHNYLSEAQVLSLQQAGHEIQSHSVSHPNLAQLDQTRLTHEVAQSKADISKLTKRPVTDFASPLSAYDRASIDEIKRHYRSHRNTEASVVQPAERDFNTRMNFDRWQIKAFSVRNNTTTGQIENFLAKAKQLNAWAVLVYHEVDENSESYYNVTPGNFSKQMQAVRDSKLRIATMDEVLDQLDRGQSNRASVARRQ